MNKTSKDGRLKMCNMLYFEISGKQAEFTPPDTTASKLTYDFIPFTSIRGLLGAVMGYDRQKYSRMLCSQHISLGLEILDMGETYTYGTNHRKLKKNVQGPASISAKRNVRYGIYVKSRDESFSDIIYILYEKLKYKKYAFPLTLGKKYCSATIDCVEIVETNPIKVKPNDQLSIHSIVPTEIGNAVRPTKIEYMPFEYQFEEKDVHGSFKEVYYSDTPIDMRITQSTDLYKVSDKVICMI